MDGMDQSHSRIPYLGSAISLSESLTMHIEGVNDHGSKVRTNNFISIFIVLFIFLVFPTRSNIVLYIGSYSKVLRSYLILYTI